MVGCVEGILGLRPTPEGLKVSPAIPAEWDGFTMDKTFRGKRLHIVVDNAAHHEGGVEKLYLNGTEIPVGVIADELLTDGAEIKVVM
jgi:cellobiose phosphorylase